MNLLFVFVLFPLDSEPALYGALFLILMLSGVGLPVPEEVTLIFAGYLAYLGFIDFWTAAYVLIAGIVGADVVGFLLGRYAMERVFGFMRRWRGVHALFARAERLFARYGDTIVVLSRPLVGVRVAVPVLAGYTGMRFWKFLVLDLAAAIPWTFGLVFVSYYLGSGLDIVIGVRIIRHALFLSVGLAIAAAVAVRWIKRGR